MNQIDQASPVSLITQFGYQVMRQKRQDRSPVHPSSAIAVPFECEAERAVFVMIDDQRSFQIIEMKIMANSSLMLKRNSREVENRKN